MTKTLILLSTAALFMSLMALQAPTIPTFYDNQPIYLEWDATPTEQADGIVRFELFRQRVPWQTLVVTVPSPTGHYRVQMPPELVWVDTFSMGFRGCSKWECSDVVWTDYRVIAGTSDTPGLPQSLRIGPPPLLSRPIGR